VAVSPHHLASEAAVEVMRNGGSAADAVVAANAVLGMVLPTTCGIGGDLFAIVHSPGWDAPRVLNASGRGGSGLDAEALRNAGHEGIPVRGVESITVPGCVDGWEALLERHGKMPLADLLEPAIAMGSEGFPVSAELASDLSRLQEALAGQKSAPPLYPGGAPPEPGATLRRPGLAATLARIAESGRAGFYSGPVAAAVIGATEGTLTSDDLEGNTPDWVDPIGARIFGLDAWTVPPNSQGYLTLAAAMLFEALEAPTDPEDPGFHHAVIESYRAVAWERNDYVADPGHVPIPLDRLLDRDRLLERYDSILADAVADRPASGPAPGGTAYFCAVDGEGMAVSCIQSNFYGIGTGISAGATGVFLHNRGAGFTLEPGHPNEAAPGKRPLHTLAPTLWTRDRDPALVLGTRGGHQQPQYLLQMTALMLSAGLPPEEAQAFPRWNDGRWRTGAPGSVVSVEAGMPEQVVAGLRSRGHVVDIGPERPQGWGPVSLVAISADGTRTGAADPRVSSASANGD
jgi:gamma-glutamyltranspeptidase/glutathione hydrolase